MAQQSPGRLPAPEFAAYAQVQPAEEGKMSSVLSCFAPGSDGFCLRNLAAALLSEDDNELIYFGTKIDDLICRIETAALDETANKKFPCGQARDFLQQDFTQLLRSADDSGHLSLQKAIAKAMAKGDPDLAILTIVGFNQLNNAEKMLEGFVRDAEQASASSAEQPQQPPS